MSKPKILIVAFVTLILIALGGVLVYKKQGSWRAGMDSVMKWRESRDSSLQVEALPQGQGSAGGLPIADMNSTLKIGALLPLTGEASSYGEDCRRGIELAFQDLSKKYPLKKLDIIFEDTKADPKSAISAFNKLANVDKVQAIIGDMFSSTTLAVAPLAQQAKIILLSPTAADEKIPATGDQIFSIYPPATSEGRFMANHMEVSTIRRVAVLYQNQTATKAIADAFTAAVKDRGGSVVLSESIPEEKSTYRSLMGKVAAKKPTSIYISAYRDPVALLIVAGKEMSLQTVYATQSTLYDEKALIDYANKLNGVMVSGPYFDSENGSEAVVRFSTSYAKQFSRPPSVWSAYGYDAADILITALVESSNQGVEPKNKLVGSVFNGLTGRTVIQPDRSIDKEMVLYRVKENKFIRE
ncbi:Leu/Ile/Val-binding protein [Anaerolineae bacterium]|nr:Leu/Ile/Val-binding protein [Anaerolineae bacterium]